jgi:hypothetical protein
MSSSQASKNRSGERRTSGGTLASNLSNCTAHVLTFYEDDILAFFLGSLFVFCNINSNFKIGTVLVGKATYFEFICTVRKYDKCRNQLVNHTYNK